MKFRINLYLLIVLLLAGYFVKSQPIAQWRGLNRDGIYKESDLLKMWPAEGPKLLWETEALGCGYGSLVVFDNTLYINGEVDSVSYLFAFDVKGNLRWKTPNGREFFGDGFSSSYPGGRSTPTVYNGLVYVCSGLGRIACINAETGKEIWSKHMVDNLGGAPNYFGFSESLLVDDNYVYGYIGGKESNVICLDRLTGNVVWTSTALSQNAAFCSPIMITLPDRKLFVTISKDHLFALDAKDGKLLWSVKEDSLKFDDEYCNTPIYSDGYIYSISGVEKGTGTIKLKLSPDGTSVQEVWRNGNLKNIMGGFILADNKLYATSRDKKLKCIEIASGAVVDTVRSVSGALIYADNQLYCYGDNGNMNLIGLNGSKMELISKFKIKDGTKEHLAHPVISNGVLYIRHGNALMAYQIK